MSSTDGEAGMRHLTDKATYERLEKDVAAVKNDIAALTTNYRCAQFIRRYGAKAGAPRLQASPRQRGFGGG